ncbi:hypothetical protein [Paenibacillus pseudetheri]|uniref:Uncharacterized protein n=1 Tax=Paenibacillus pseudetheri TaxID=2897682 RepID=A0ABN8FVL4_9BACL|nr:hypothetical protein [Paenibacillus pseudetheri]CAH1059689.1 hypothetical protein PAECIP111894_05901 [Paenibacillus pseudetheri]
MEFIEKSIKPLVKKYPLLSKVILAVLIFDIVYYTGKEIGRMAYYMNH